MKKYTKICLDEITRETEKALLIEGTWLPKSQLLVVINNQYLDIDTKEIKEVKEKSPYCLLCPLWLHMKNNLSFKNSYTLEDWQKDLNVDMRTNEKYEIFKILTYKEYKILED